MLAGSVCVSDVIKGARLQARICVGECFFCGLWVNVCQAVGAQLRGCIHMMSVCICI